MENVSDPVTVHFEVAITQLANVVSASSSPCVVPQGVLTLRGSEQFPNIVPLIVHGKYEKLKKYEQTKIYMAAGPSKLSHWEGDSFPTDAVIIHIKTGFFVVVGCFGRDFRTSL